MKYIERLWKMTNGYSLGIPNLVPSHQLGQNIHHSLLAVAILVGMMCIVVLYLQRVFGF